MGRRGRNNPVRRLAEKNRVITGLFRGESISSIAADLQVLEDHISVLIGELTREWQAGQFEQVDRWKSRLLGELEDLKQELYRRYTGEYDGDDQDPSGRLVQSTEVNTTGTRPSTSTTEVRKPLGLELATLQEIRAIIADQRKILGIDAPVQTRSIHLHLTGEQLRSLPDEELDKLISEIGGPKLLEDLQEAEKTADPDEENLSSQGEIDE